MSESLLFLSYLFKCRVSTALRGVAVIANPTTSVSFCFVDLSISVSETELLILINF